MRIGKGTTRGTLLLIRGTIGVGTPHNLERKIQDIGPIPYLKLGGWVGGWVDGWGSLHYTASLKLHLASWNLKDFQSS